MSSKTKKSAFMTPSHALRNLALLLAAGLILIVLPIGRLSALGESLLLIPFVLAIAVTAHEFGHLFAAVVVRFRPAVLVLGNIWVRFLGPRPRVGLSPAFMVGGYVIASPTREPSRLSATLFFLGGVIANLVMVIAPFFLLILIALLMPAHAPALIAGGVSFVVMLALYNLILVALVLVPRMYSGFMTDGGYVRETLRNPSFAGAYGNVMKLACQQFEGVRPRDWDRELCQRSLKGSTDYTDPMYIFMLAYYIEIDSRNLAKAEELLAEAAQLKETANLYSLEPYNVESAFFYGFYKPSASLCQQYIDQCLLLDLMPETRDRLEAALAFSKGEFDKARRYGRLLLDGLRPPMSPGLDRYIRDSMADLITECERRLAPTNTATWD